MPSIDSEAEDRTPHPFATIIGDIALPLVITDPNVHDNPIIFANDAFAQLSAYPNEETTGRNCRFLQGPDTDRADVRRISLALAEAQPINVDLLNYRKDGTTFWNALHISPIRGKDGGVRFYFASQVDVSSHIEAQREIHRQRAELASVVGARRVQLQDALERSVAALEGIDQRVRNNLTTINALVTMRASVLEDETLFGSILDDLQRRIRALTTSLPSL